MTKRSRAPRLSSSPGRARASTRRGSAGVTLLFWLFALCLFALPFLGQPTRADVVDWTTKPEGAEWSSIDPGRNLELDIPFALDVSDFDEEFAGEFEQDLATVIGEASEKYYGQDSELLAQSGLLDVSRLAAGERAYDYECAGCHGRAGDGGGPSARFLAPRPRNFRKGKFKFTSTATGERPRREDLMRTITNGLVGSAMPKFPLISEERRWDIVEYVRYLSIRGEFEQIMIDTAWNEEEIPDPEEIAEIVNGRWDSDALKVVFPIVQADLQKQAAETGPIAPSVGLDPTYYQQFAVTNDGVIFFFGQGQLLPEVAGPVQVLVPRSAIDPMLA